MTIRNYTRYVVDSAEKFQNELDVDGKEILLALSDVKQEKILDFFNQERGTWGESKADSIEELPEWVFEEWEEWADESIQVIIMEVLALRDTEYVVRSDISVHQIFELEDDDE